MQSEGSEACRPFRQFATARISLAGTYIEVRQRGDGPAFGYSHLPFTSRRMVLPLIGCGIAFLVVRLVPDGILRRQIERALGPDINAVDQDFFSLRIREWRRTAVLLTPTREEVRLDRDLKESSAKHSRIHAPLVFLPLVTQAPIGEVPEAQSCWSTATER